MRSLSQTTAPTVEPLALQEALDHIRVASGVDDVLVTALITAARMHVESYLRRQLITAGWTLYLDRFPDGDTIWLDYPPVQSVTTLKYYNEAGTLTTWSATNYQVDGTALGGRVVLSTGITWPTVSGYKRPEIQIAFQAGYGAAGSSVPAPIRQAILLLIGDMYEHREAKITGTIVAENSTVERLLYPYRYITWHGEDE